MNFFRARRKLGPKNIFINEDLTKENHKLLLHVKKTCPEGVSVYSVDGSIMARTSDRVYRIKRKEDLKKYGLTALDAEVAENEEIVEQDGLKTVFSIEHSFFCLFIYSCRFNIFMQQQQVSSLVLLLIFSIDGG